MNTNILTKFGVVLFLLLLVVLAGGIFVYAQIVDGTIRACVHPDGSMAAIIPGFPQPTNCKATLKWSVQGPQGPIGPQGPAGQQLHLFDGNGQDLGILISVNVPKTYLLTLGVITQFYVSGQQRIDLITRGEVFFSEPDCTGIPYARAAANDLPDQLQAIYAINPDFPGRFRIVPGTSFASFVSQSFPTGDPRRCINSTATQMGYPLEPVTFPFTEPLAYPLRVGMSQ